jgi:hypothetical protein
MAGDAECAIGAPSNPARMRRAESGWSAADFKIGTFEESFVGELHIGCKARIGNQ